MIHKCANPDCHTAFKYFRDGKLYEFPVGGRPGAKPAMGSLRKMFWLCEPCSRNFTLALEEGAVVTRPRKTA